jgi:hypothetical protein
MDLENDSQYKIVPVGARLDKIRTFVGYHPNGLLNKYITQIVEYCTIVEAAEKYNQTSHYFR